MPLPFPYGLDGDLTPRGVGFRLSPDLPSRPHQNEGDTLWRKFYIGPEAVNLLGETARSAGIYFCSRFSSVNHVLHFRVHGFVSAYEATARLGRTSLPL